MENYVGMVSCRTSSAPGLVYQTEFYYDIVVTSLFPDMSEALSHPNREV